MLINMFFTIPFLSKRSCLKNMGILSALAKGINAAYTDYTKPKSFKKGEKFEDFTRREIFVDKYYELISRTPDFVTNSKDYELSSLDPDFTFRDRVTKKTFYVECKFRSDFFKDKIEWTNPKQLERYRKCHQQYPVFVLIGRGDNPSYPEALSLIPLNEAKYTGLYFSVLKKFGIDPDHSLPSSLLWSR